MQNSSLPPLAQVLDEELIQGPPEEAPTLDEGLIRGPSDPPTEVEPFPVQEAEVSPRNWVVDALGAFFTSPNHAKSIQENVLDTLKLFLPAGPRASGKWTAVPGVADLTRLIAEAGVVSSRYRAETTLGTGTPPIKAALEGIFRGYMEVDERLFGGAEQEGDETPMFDAFADYITGRYDFRQPAVRAAFSQVVREDPWGVLTDLMTIPSLAFGGAGIGTRAATTSAKVSARMSKILGIPQKLNRAFNQGFHLPLVPRLLPAPVKRRMQSRISEGKFKGGKFEFKTGIADGLDPGVWAVRGAGRAISEGARRIPDALEVSQTNLFLCPETPQQRLERSRLLHRVDAQHATVHPYPYRKTPAERALPVEMVVCHESKEYASPPHLSQTPKHTQPVSYTHLTLPTILLV